MRTLSTILSVSLVAVLGAGEVVLGPAESQGRALVSAVQAGREADLVVVAGGHAQGLRPGMVCAVVRAGAPVAKVIVAESAAERSVALVLALAPSAEIRPGDSVEARANTRI